MSSPFPNTAHGGNWHARIAALALTAALLAGCGANSAGDKVTIGTGQGGGTDPVTQDSPIFYVKRPAPTAAQLMNQTDNVLELRQFEPGADLYMRANASPSAAETNITGALTQGMGDVRDVDVSWDGTRVIFAMRFPYDPNINNEKDQPSSWDIYEYNVQTGVLRGLVVDPPINPGEDRNDDRFPHYLPDGQHIIFSSTRQRTSQAILLDENQQQFEAQDENNNAPAFVLHRMAYAPDASPNVNTIEQLSYNQSDDMDAAILPDGRIVFSRWDGIGGGPDAVSLYTIDPDGTDLELYYGRQPCTHLMTNGVTNCTIARATTPAISPIQFLAPRTLLNGQVLSLVRPMSGTFQAGDMVSIDANDYVEFTQPTLPNTGVLSGPGHTRISPIDVNTNPNTPSIGGLYRSVFPLADGSNRLLISWAPCQVIQNGSPVPCTSDVLAQQPPPTPATPSFGIYIYDQNQNTQLPIVTPQQGVMFTDVVAAAPRTAPAIVLDKAAGVDYASELDSQAAGILDIKSVYDFDGVDTAPGGIPSVRDPAGPNWTTRPARFLRIEKAVSLPSRDIRDIKNTSFSPAGRFMRQILGYAPIEPDGSVKVKVPANVAIQIAIVDQNARRINSSTAQGFSGPRHLNWLQVRPGETVTCNGCHAPQAANATVQRSHGRKNLTSDINPGAPATGLFPHTDSALQGNPGETMAETRASWMCRLSIGSACSPSVDVIYDDLWTDPAAAGRPKETSFDYCYSAVLTDVASDVADSTVKHLCTTKLDTPAPTPDGCEKNWTSNCRIVIEYLDHIQPLWDKPRPDATATVDNVCTSCHSPTNAMSQAQVPAGQLDLTSVDSTDEPDHVTSYQNLLFTHNAQELNGTMLRDVCAVARDPMTDLCPNNQFVTVSAPMIALNARSSRFFTAINDATHTGMMTSAELRLISEWLDIGAQYYNDPFKAPTN